MAQSFTRRRARMFVRVVVPSLYPFIFADAAIMLRACLPGRFAVSDTFAGKRSIHDAQRREDERKSDGTTTRTNIRARRRVKLAPFRWSPYRDRRDRRHVDQRERNEHTLIAKITVSGDTPNHMIESSVHPIAENAFRNGPMRRSIAAAAPAHSTRQRRSAAPTTERDRQSLPPTWNSEEPKMAEVAPACDEHPEP